VSAPKFHRAGRTLSASSLLAALGDALGRIRAEDGLTWDDVGRVLGKHGDTAAHYADASAEMGVLAYHLGRREWGSRFTGEADKLLGDASGEQCPRRAQTLILHAALTLSAALEDDDLTDAEIAASRGTLENARDAIDHVLARLTPRSVA